MSTGNDACSPRDLTLAQVLSVHPSCLVTVDGFWATINFHPFLVLIALLIPFFVVIELFLSPCLRAFFSLPPKATRQQYGIFVDTVSLEFHVGGSFLRCSVQHCDLVVSSHLSKSKLQEGTTRPTAPRFFVAANAANAFLKRSNVALILLINFIVFVTFIEFCTYDGNSRNSYSM